MKKRYLSLFERRLKNRYSNLERVFLNPIVAFIKKQKDEKLLLRSYYCREMVNPYLGKYGYGEILDDLNSFFGNLGGRLKFFKDFKWDFSLIDLDKPIEDAISNILAMDYFLSKGITNIELFDVKGSRGRPDLKFVETNGKEKYCEVKNVWATDDKIFRFFENEVFYQLSKKEQDAFELYIPVEFRFKGFSTEFRTEGKRDWNLLRAIVVRFIGEYLKNKSKLRFEYEDSLRGKGIKVIFWVHKADKRERGVNARLKFKNYISGMDVAENLWSIGEIRNFLGKYNEAYNRIVNFRFKDITEEETPTFGKIDDWIFIRLINRFFHVGNPTEELIKFTSRVMGLDKIAHLKVVAYGG